MYMKAEGSAPAHRHKAERQSPWEQNKYQKKNDDGENQEQSCKGRNKKEGKKQRKEKKQEKERNSEDERIFLFFRSIRRTWRKVKALWETWRPEPAKKASKEKLYLFFEESGD